MRLGQLGQLGRLGRPEQLRPDAEAELRRERQRQQRGGAGQLAPLKGGATLILSAEI